MVAGQQVLLAVDVYQGKPGSRFASLSLQK
jgi:hypothetical protein